MSLSETEIFQEIAIELAVDPSFVEKDWYAVKLLSVFSDVDFVDIVFTGGTSLSKGYNLIQRFSEDLDFRICSEISMTRGQRKSIRKRILNIVNSVEDISIVEDSLLSQNESRFFSIDVFYPQKFPLQYSLRPYLKLEFTFENTIEPPEKRDIYSFVSRLLEKEADCTISTISPIETGANKYSALIWRMSIKDRTSTELAKNDPALIRHLYDLAALNPLLMESFNFVDLVKHSFVEDKGRGGSDKNAPLIEYSKSALASLTSDSLYKAEYEQFVMAMSYATDSEEITFERAVEDFRLLVEWVLGS